MGGQGLAGPRAGGSGGAAASPPDLHDVLASVTDGFLAFDRDWRITYVNAAAERLLGARSADLLGRVQWEVWPETSGTAVERGYRRAMAERVPVEFENLYEPWGRWFEVRAFPSADGIAVYFRDVTGRREAAEALRRSEARLALALEGTSDGLWDWDLVAGEVYHSPRFAAMLGYGPGEWESTYGNWIAHTHPDDVPGVERMVRDYLAGTLPEYVNVFRMRHRDGGWRWMMSRAKVFRDAAGRPTRMVGAHTDVTTQREAEEALRRGEGRLRIATEGAGVGIWEIDVVAGHGTWSLGAAGLAGLGREGFTAADWVELAHPEDRAALALAWRRALGEGLPYEAEFRAAIPAPDGGERWLLSRGRVERDGAGRPLRGAGVLMDVTARRRAEAALAESERQFRLLADLAPAFVWFAAPDGGVRYLNGRWHAYTGQSAAEALPDGWAATLHPDDAGPVLEAWARARRDGTHYEVECRYRRHDGAYRWHVARAEPVRDGSGAVTAWFGTSTDIHDRREAEEALRASERRLQLAKQAAGIGVWDWDLGTNGITWSPEMYGLLGIDPATPPGDLYAAWLRALHPGDRAGADAVARRGAATGEPFSTDFRVVLPGGGVRWVRSQATAVAGPGGRPARLAGINVDVTAQHRLEEELRARADRLAAAVEERTRERDRVFELSNDLFASAGLDGFLKAVNPAWGRLLGYTEAELLARPFAELVHPDDRAAAAGVVASLAAGEAVPHFEDRLLRKDGGVVWVSWAAVPEGERFYAVGRDVTREREREEALRQAQKMEAMGQLTGGVAHDFNNLLTPIMGALDMLLARGVGGERERRLLAGALQSAERARTLVERLLAFARRQPLQPVAVDVGRLARGMGGLLASTAGPQVRVVVDAPGGLPPAKADPNQLEMAILNLGVNARDAMPDGGTLRVAVDAPETGPDHPTGLRPGRYVRLSVADTGVGMDAGTLARAVEPFFSTKGVGRGTGLGLSMAHGLAAQLGGALRIQSRPGMGTTVELWLPLGEGEVAGEAVTGGVALPAGRGTVLLVDDEEAVRASAAAMLAGLGYAVEEAPSAEVALGLLDAGLRPDVVVTDHLMAGMPGTELARAVRGRLPGTRVLVVSGYAEEGGIDPDLPRLRKPFRATELAAALAALA